MDMGYRIKTMRLKVIFMTQMLSFQNHDSDFYLQISTNTEDL